MIERQLDGILEDHIKKMLGIRSHHIPLPLDLVSIACLFLMADRETAIEGQDQNPPSRYNGETFLDALTDIGIKVNGNSITKFNALIQNEYLSSDADECYSAGPASLILTGLLNRMFPKMQGLFFVSYFIQTIEEALSGRKNEKQALDQAEQMILSQGKELSFDSFSTEEKQLLKKIASQGAKAQKANPNVGELGQTFEQRTSKRDKLFSVLGIRMNKMGRILPLPYNVAKLKEVLSLDERSMIKIVDAVMTDFPLILALLEYINSKHEPKEKTGIVSVSQALMALGYDKAKEVMEAIVPCSDTEEPLLKEELEKLFHFTLLKSLVARQIAVRLEAEGIEEICVNVMFYHFGQILIMNYLPEAYKQIKRLAMSKNVDNASAARDILGVTYENIGVKIASDWRLPFNTIESMRISQQKRIGVSKLTILQTMPCYVNDICLAIGQVEMDEEEGYNHLNSFSESLNIPRNDLLNMFDMAWAEFELYFSDHHIYIARESFLTEIIPAVIQ
ncbi:MAG: HDOD domain-containing protein [Proteobacteria bacterium]|nr:HDOD domain-containing protein [Pseudomonadota bacterium]